MRVKQRESEPNRKACSWATLRVAPAEGPHFLAEVRAKGSLFPH